MDPDVVVHSSVHEVEFWKRYGIIKQMLANLENQQYFLHSLQHEDSIPGQQRDTAVAAVRGEYEENLCLFHDFLLNIINFSIQGLHRLDIQLSLTIGEAEEPQLDRAWLFVDGKSHPLPSMDGVRWMGAIKDFLGNTDVSFHPEGMIRLYKTIQTRYDRILGGSLDSCSLLLQEEIYPSRAYHILLRLPASAFLDLEQGDIFPEEET